jgi:gluconolactonase
MSLELSLLETLVSGLDHPEGIAYAPDGHAYASGEGGQVYRINLADRTFSQFAQTGGFGLGIAIDAVSNLYVCDMGVKAVVKVTPSGETSTYSTGTAHEPLTVPNFPVFDASGNLFVSNSGAWGQENGTIYRIQPGGTAEVWSRASAGYTNGMALSPDGTHLYVVESTPPLISRIAIQPDGSAGAREVVVELPRTVPDGICFDVNGGLYISCYSPDRIYRLSATGALDVLFDDWARMQLNAPTNVAFVGEKLNRLAAASLGGYSIAWADIGVTGARLHYPAL